jgi:hypothetical protein
MADWKGYTWTSEHGYTFAQVWNFLEYGNVLDTRVEFSNELMIGLFWEESIFQNWWQKGKNGEDLKQHASGFGQIERKTLGIMNALYAEKRMKYTPELIVSDPQISYGASFRPGDKIYHSFGFYGVRYENNTWSSTRGDLVGSFGIKFDYLNNKDFDLGFRYMKASGKGHSRWG